MEVVLLVLVFAAAFGLVIFIRVTANKDTRLGRFCKWYWNVSFKIAAHIPFSGWMARFIIGDEKDFYIKIGEQSDAFGWKLVENEAERNRLERERDERIRAEVAQRCGGNVVSINGDGSSATYEDKKGNRHDINIIWK